MPRALVRTSAHRLEITWVRATDAEKIGAAVSASRLLPLRREFSSARSRSQPAGSGWEAPRRFVRKSGAHGIRFVCSDVSSERVRGGKKRGMGNGPDEKFAFYFWHSISIGADWLPFCT
jgi:hypothetical protein